MPIPETFRQRQPGKQREVRRKNAPKIKLGRKLAYGVRNIISKNRSEIMCEGQKWGLTLQLMF